MAGPAGAFVGVMAADFAHRVLSDREAQRVATVVERAAEHFVALEMMGHRPRADFVDDIDSADAQELVEGLLIAARDAFEEKKLDHIAYLLARLAVDQTIAPVRIAHLVHEARSLTFTQYCLLEIYAEPARFDLATSRLRGPARMESLDMLSSVWALLQAGYLRLAGDGYMLRALDMAPAGLEAFGEGEVLRIALNLQAIDGEDLERVAEALRWEPNEDD